MLTEVKEWTIMNFMNLVIMMENNTSEIVSKYKRYYQQNKEKCMKKHERTYEETKESFQIWLVSNTRHYPMNKNIRKKSTQKN